MKREPFGNALNKYIDFLCSITRYDKIAIQGKGPDGKWRRKPLAYQESNTFHLCVTRPPDKCVTVNLVFKYIHNL